MAYPLSLTGTWALEGLTQYVLVSLAIAGLIYAVTALTAAKGGNPVRIGVY
jgi:hypothetical protein